MKKQSREVEIELGEIGLLLVRTTVGKSLNSPSSAARSPGVQDVSITLAEFHCSAEFGTLTPGFDKSVVYSLKSCGSSGNRYEARPIVET